MWGIKLLHRCTCAPRLQKPTPSRPQQVLGEPCWWIWLAYSSMFEPKFIVKYAMLVSHFCRSIQPWQGKTPLRRTQGCRNHHEKSPVAFIKSKLWDLQYYIIILPLGPLTLIRRPFTSTVTSSGITSWRDAWRSLIVIYRLLCLVISRNFLGWNDVSWGLSKRR